MPRWEVCRIVEITLSEAREGGGLFSRPNLMRTDAWAAEGFAPGGETRSVARTSGWDCKGHWSEGGNICYAPEAKLRQQQLHSLIAQLGLDGWEPMPLVLVGGSYGDTSYIHWYFKRQLHDT